MWKHLFFVLFLKSTHVQAQVVIVPASDVPRPASKQGTQSGIDTIVIGSCKIAVNRLCPDPDVTFYLYSKKFQEEPEPVRIGGEPGNSNLSSTTFDPSLPTKIVIHGYNSDRNLNVLIEIKKQYFNRTTDLNIFFVDWSSLAAGPCYPAAVWNTRHVGECTSQLVDRIKELGAKNIHLIGFSLGGQLTNFVANALRPYKVSRITGLDPAGPGFLTAGPENKLDKGDAEFVDVIHTNAFVQGIVEESGHVDFYINGGVIQPGCWAENRFFACNHHRAPLYFAESITTQMGFWGWPCPSYTEYLIGRCPPKEPQIIMGEFVNRTSSGVHLVITDSVSPFAVGKFTGPAIEIFVKSELIRRDILEKYKKDVENFIDEDDVVESLYEHSRLKNEHSKKKSENIIDSVSAEVDLI
ncbi:lipase member H-A [Tribolium castaneum]|uniref:lipase member H-A n=1 Tax=Tribolium castaneum TaxID=7070 RepID=UPI0030FEA824